MPNDRNKITLGFVPANRALFSLELASKTRKEALAAMQEMGIDVVVPGESQTKAGCVENLAEAELCARMFREKAVDGIVIGACNFGDEQAAAWVVREAKLGVPILLFGAQEEAPLTRQISRRDSFCGLLSIGDALRQIGAKYSVATTPICFPSDESFRSDLDWFLRVCRVVGGIRNARYGQLGTRPDAFWTCRFDERQLQRLGPTTVVADLSEVLSGLEKIPDSDPELVPICKELSQYDEASHLAKGNVTKFARLELFLKRWKKEHDIDAFAIQCWTSIQKLYGVCTCSTMSRLNDMGTPCACETDILGAMSMHACQLASGSPAGLADWNNLHNKDKELVNLWHCGVFPTSFAKDRPKLVSHAVLVLGGAVRPENAEGVFEFEVIESPLTVARIAQDEGEWKAVIAEGRVEDNPAETFGAYGWCRIPGLQRLYREVLLHHFPHHAAMTQAHVGNVLWEAFGKYLGLKVFHAAQETPGLYTPRLPF